MTARSGRARRDWLAPGDVNGFLALALDNVTNLVILSSLLIGVFTLLVLGNGFILTALVWASAVALLIDGHKALAAVALAVGSVATLFGLMHSPVASGAVFWPWAAPSGLSFQLAGGYGVAAALLWLASTTTSPLPPVEAGR